jgi:hypothetical protein
LLNARIEPTPRPPRALPPKSAGRFLLAAAAVLAAALPAAIAPAHRLAAAPARVDFNRDVRPILSDRCYKCHGPDAGARKAGLRLDAREGAFGELPSGRRALRPGDPEGSALYRRIAAADPDERMPPPDSQLELSAAEIALLKRWIEEGAEWKGHWAFLPPSRPPLPAPRNASWPRGAIDAFIAARLEAEGLAPAPEASKERLLRRASFDLAGLPPEIDEIDAFLADERPDAFERAADRLLASPALGERLAVDWLDAARYADTHGYQVDRYRPVWPWRDWVIDAFNRGLSYDRFVLWQIAGDLVPHATKEQRLATAFNRLHLQTEEGGSIEEEFRVLYVVDRVNTFGTVFLGLTLECSRCHEHKFDPIPQQDFYRLFSFFNNIDECGQATYFTGSTPVPTLLLTDDADDEKIAGIERRVRDIEAGGEALRARQRPAFAAWLAQGPKSAAIPGAAGDFPLDAIEGGKLENRADPSRPGGLIEGPSAVPGKEGGAIALDGENGLVFPGVGAFTRDDPFSLAFWMRPGAKIESAVLLHRTKAALDAGSRGYETAIDRGRVVFGLAHMWPGNAARVRTREAVTPGRWTHVAATYDGSSRAAGLKIYLDGVEAALEVVRDHLYKHVTYEHAPPELSFGSRFRDRGFKGGAVDEVKVFARRLSAIEAAEIAGRGELSAALGKAPAALDAGERERLFDYYLENFDAEHRSHLASLRAARGERSAAVDPVPEIMAMEELPAPRPAFVLKRGAYDAPGEAVDAGTPACLPPMAAELPRNRLGLARWLLEPSHPLMGRVTANRYWQLVFGRGLVETAEDFGSQGSLPSHPELLDWLAREVIDSGWDLKRFLGRLVASAAYRQDSTAGDEKRARDPENRLLARGPQHRLSAEALRDLALDAGGLLVPRLGGPSVKPYQPAGLWEEKSGAAYEQDHGESLYRRSLYTFWKRTSPHPMMATFDAAERNTCTVRRQRTSTPLQALVLMNDPQFVEAARAIARRAMRETDASRSARIERIFRRLSGRFPSAGERGVLDRLAGEQAALFGADPASAAALLAVGESPPDPALDPIEHAALTVVASALLNFDEVVTQR